jgi:hypothetical protein
MTASPEMGQVEKRIFICAQMMTIKSGWWWATTVRSLFNPFIKPVASE